MTAWLVLAQAVAPVAPVLAPNNFDPTIVAAAMVTVIAALVSGVVAITNAISAANDRKDARTERASLAKVTTATDHKADTIIQKATEIHTLTNSNLARLQKQFDVALARIEGLQQLVVSLQQAKGIADSLAQSSLPNARPASTTDLLESIDEHTAATADNTAADLKNDLKRKDVLRRSDLDIIAAAAAKPPADVDGNKE